MGGGERERDPKDGEQRKNVRVILVLFLHMLLDFFLARWIKLEEIVREGGEATPSFKWAHGSDCVPGPGILVQSKNRPTLGGMHDNQVEKLRPARPHTHT